MLIQDRKWNYQMKRESEEADSEKNRLSKRRHVEAAPLKWISTKLLNEKWENLERKKKGFNFVWYGMKASKDIVQRLESPPPNETLLLSSSLLHQQINFHQIVPLLRLPPHIFHVREEGEEESKCLRELGNLKETTQSDDFHFHIRIRIQIGAIWKDNICWAWG